MSIVLAIDTSTEYLSLALRYNGVTDHYIEKVGSKHSELIIEQIDKLLAKHGIKALDINTIMYIEGPGSFTGLRIGLSVALGLSYAANAVLVPVPSFMLYAQDILGGPAYMKLTVGIDARLNEIYLATVDLQSMQYINQPTLIKPQDIIFEDDTQYIGSGFSVYKDEVNKEIIANVIQQDNYPTALNMLKLIGSIRPLNPQDATLSYIRNKVALSLTEQALNK